MHILPCIQIPDTMASSPENDIVHHPYGNDEDSESSFNGVETDLWRLSQQPGSMNHHRSRHRRKQIQIGKTTFGYHAYIHHVPQFCREADNQDHPITPRFDQQCSKRSWCDVPEWLYRCRLSFFTGMLRCVAGGVPSTGGMIMTSLDIDRGCK